MQGHVRAVDDLKEIAEKNVADAVFIVGKLYEIGEVIGKDIDVAIEYYERAAKQGHAKALEKLQNIGRKGNVSIQLILGDIYNNLFHTTLLLDLV